MNRRSWWVSSCCLLLAVVVLAAVAQAQPPLHQVDGRWSAWDPPTGIPEGAQVYTVVRGDTLWDLAQKFLGDPYRWPQIWEANRYILDAEWIYPGDPLIIPGAMVADTQGVAGPSITEDPQAGMPSDEDPFRAMLEGETEEPVVDTSGFSMPPEVSSERPVAVGFESDIYCTGYIGDLEESFPYRIAGSEYEFQHPTLDPFRNSEISGIFGKSDTVKYALGISDIVYLEGGRADGLSAGTVLVAIQPLHKVVHPITDKLMGRYYHYLSRIRVLSVQEETAIGEIIASCDPVTVGAQLRIFEPEPVPLRRLTPMRPVNYPSGQDEVDAGPRIIMARDKVVALGTGHLVFIDRGAEGDVAPGDMFTIYRQGRRGFPPIVLGEAAVLSVSERASLARIIRSRYTIFVGDAFVLK